MKTRNCPNCAAPYNVNFYKCPYCSTPYFDISNLDIQDGNPFYLKIKKERATITLLVRLKNASITQEDDIIAANMGNYPLMTFTTSVNMKTTLDLEVIPQNGVLMTLVEEEG